jgi:type IV pilus assembly protein PilM
MFFNNKSYTSVDIGTSAVKIVNFKVAGEKIKIIKSDIASLPQGAVAEGEIKDHSIVANLINKIFNKMKLNPKNILTAVSSYDLLIRNIEVPNIGEKEIKESLKWEADNQLPYSVDIAALDYILVEKNEDTVKYMATAVKQKTVENLTELFARINLTPSVVNVQPMALISLLEYQNQIEGNIAIIDIGYSGTQITIGNKDNILLSRTIEIGSDDFTKVIAEDLSVDYERAEVEKIESGLKAKSNSEEELMSLELGNSFSEKNIETTINSLYQELNRSFDYFSVKNRGEEISKVYLTGGGSRLKGLTDFLEEESGREVFRINPLKNIEVNSLSNAYCNECLEEFAVAVGLGVSEVMADEG